MVSFNPNIRPNAYTFGNTQQTKKNNNLIENSQNLTSGQNFNNMNNFDTDTNFEFDIEPLINGFGDEIGGNTTTQPARAGAKIVIKAVVKYAKNAIKSLWSDVKTLAVWEAIGSLLDDDEEPKTEEKNNTKK